MKIRIIAAAAGLLALATATACAPRAGTTTAGNQPRQGVVKEDHFARIPEAQLAPVQDVRDEIRDLRDELVRAEQQVKVADEESRLGTANLEVERAKAKAAKQNVDLAQSTGDRARIETARAEQTRADAGVELQLAKAELVARRRDGNDLAARAVKAKLGVAEAKLEQVKLGALRASGDAAADEYDDAAFQRSMLSAKSALEQAEKGLLEHDAILQQAEMRVKAAETALSTLGDADDRQPVRGEDADEPETEPEPPVEPE